MRLPERDPYAPREWQPHEKPALLGSPSTPEHSTPKRIAYGVVGLLVCLTGARECGGHRQPAKFAGHLWRRSPDRGYRRSM